MAIEIKKLQRALCVHCDKILLVDPETTLLGQYVTCTNCSGQLEVMDVNPVLLGWVINRDSWEEAPLMISTLPLAPAIAAP